MADATLIARMRALCPEFASAGTYPDATLGIYLDGWAAQVTGTRHFGSGQRRTDALCYAAGHRLTMVLRGAGGAGTGMVGAVASASAGPQSVSYDAGLGGYTSVGALGADMRQTPHGLAWLGLRWGAAAAVPGLAGS